MHQYYCKDTDYLFIIFAALILSITTVSFSIWKIYTHRLLCDTMCRA